MKDEGRAACSFILRSSTIATPSVSGFILHPYTPHPSSFVTHSNRLFELTQLLSTAAAERTAAVEQIRAAVGTLNADLRAARAERADDERARRAAFAEQSRYATAQLLATYREERLAQTADVRGGLRAYAEGLRTDTAGFLHALEQARPRREARRPVQPFVAPQPPAPADTAPTPPAPHPAPSDDIRDDLTRIRGVGPGTQARLNKAGIFTFIQIALSTPEELRGALGGSTSRLAAVEEWITQASRLAGLA